MNYYELVTMSDRVDKNLHFIIDSLRQGIPKDDIVEWTIKKLRETQIQSELLKDKLMQINMEEPIKENLNELF